MPKVQIDDKEYELEDLSQLAKDTLASLRFAESEIMRANGQLAALQTARAAYAKALKEELSGNGSLERGDEPDSDPEQLSDTITFD